MKNHGEFQLRDPNAMPTSAVLEQVMGDSFAAYEIFQDSLHDLAIEQDWQWYTPRKAWFAKGRHWWTTPRGTRKEKNLYWLYVYKGYFSVAVWFKEKNRMAILDANVSEQTKQRIRDAETMGKLPTFPVEFNVTTSELLADIYVLLDCKKKLER